MYFIAVPILTIKALWFADERNRISYRSLHDDSCVALIKLNYSIKQNHSHAQQFARSYSHTFNNNNEVVPLITYWLQPSLVARSRTGQVTTAHERTYTYTVRRVVIEVAHASEAELFTPPRAQTARRVTRCCTRTQYDQ